MKEVFGLGFTKPPCDNCGDEATDCVTQDRATTPGSSRRVGNLSEDHLHERSDGDAGSRSGAHLVNSPALELPPHLSPGAPIRPNKLPRRAEASWFGLELDSQRESGAERVWAPDSGDGARLHGTFQHARVWSIDATASAPAAVKSVIDRSID